MLKREVLHCVNTLVDALNLCSLRLQLPFGLYDFDRVAPPTDAACAVTVYAPGSYSTARLEKVLDGTETLTQACGGSRTLRQILPPA